MKTVIAAAIAASLGVAALAQSALDEQGLTPEEVAKHRARMARKAQRAAENGGYVTLAPTGRVVRVVSAQRRAAKSALDESINVFTTTLRLPVEWGLAMYSMRASVTCFAIVLLAKTWSMSEPSSL